LKLLIVEDDLNILSLLERGLKEDGYVIDKADNGEDGEYLALINSYDVIILDWMLPIKNGIEILNSMRRKKINTPVLMLTAKDEVSDTVLALKSGCDDYLTKPFNFEELEARIEALHRRFINNYNQEIVFVDDIVVNLNTKKVVKNDVEINLSMKEFDLLYLLLENKNSFVSKSMIENLMYTNEQILSSNVISVTIHNLRKKIGDNIIKNYRGLGYKIEI